MSDTTTPPPQFTSALGDPFDPAGASNLHQPGFLGVSPDVWRSLANFGGNLAAAANARTPGGFLQYGGGFGGPFGAAVSASQGQGMQRGVDLSHMALNRAQAQNMQFQNYINALQLPLLQAKQDMQIQFLRNPQGFMQQYGLNNPTFGGDAQQSETAGSNQRNGVPFAANNPLNMRFVGQDGAVNTNGFAAFPTPEAGKAATDGLFDRYAQSGVNSLRGLISKWAPPSENNTDAYIAKVAKDTGLDPDQQIDLTSPAVKAVVQRSMAGFEGNKHANVPNAFQVAQAGNGPVPVPSQGTPQPVGNLGLVRQPDGSIGTPQAPAQPPMQLQQTMAQPGQAQSLAAQWQARAQRALQQANLIETMHSMGLPIVGDPQSLRQQAQTFTENALKLQSVGPTEAEKAANTITTDRFGNMYKGTTYLGRGSEVKEVWNPETQRYEWGDVGGVGIGAQTPAIGSGQAGTSSGMAARPGPGEVEASKLPVKIQEDFINHDNKIVEDDLSHVIDNVTPAKQQLMQLRGLVDTADTGAAGQFRADFKNWVQTFAPDYVSKLTGDAAPAQEFDKIALMGAGKQERGDLGARGGFRAIEMYRNANPSMDKQPTANRDMANALLISHQYHEDYAMGATGYFNNQVQSVLNANGGKTQYSKLSNYDSQFVKTMRPELYAAAIGAINGKPYGEWAKGLSNKQMQIVGGIVQRADPSAVVDIQGHQVPVSSFKTVIGPSDIAGTGGPGAG